MRAREHGPPRKVLERYKGYTSGCEDGAVLPILAMYITAALEQGADLKDLTGTI